MSLPDWVASNRSGFGYKWDLKDLDRVEWVIDWGLWSLTVFWRYMESWDLLLLDWVFIDF